MVGRFNPTLQMTNGKLNVAGTLDDCAGSQVHIQAGVTQKGEVVSCNKTFSVTSSPFSWSMQVSVPFVTGTPAAASALATNQNGSGQSFPWNQANIAIT